MLQHKKSGEVPQPRAPRPRYVEPAAPPAAAPADLEAALASVLRCPQGFARCKELLDAAGNSSGGGQKPAGVDACVAKLKSSPPKPPVPAELADAFWKQVAEESSEDSDEGGAQVRRKRAKTSAKPKATPKAKAQGRAKAAAKPHPDAPVELQAMAKELGRVPPPKVRKDAPPSRASAPAVALATDRIRYVLQLYKTGAVGVRRYWRPAGCKAERSKQLFQVLVPKGAAESAEQVAMAAVQQLIEGKPDEQVKDWALSGRQRLGAGSRPN